MNHYFDPVTKRAVKDYLQRGASLGYSPLQPAAAFSMRAADIITLRNRHGILARHKVSRRGKKAVESVHFLD